MKKSFLVAVVCILFNITASQAQNEHRYNIYVDGVVSEADVKIVSFIIGSLQEGTIISWRDDRSFAKVKSNTALTWSLIEVALNSEGYHLLDLESLPVVGINGRSASDLPQPISTGDPALDAKNYAIQKAQWIKDHPEQYQKLSLPSSSSTTEDPAK